jgi:4Fe-4S binding domain.
VEVNEVKAKVDPGECTGCALCVDTCPEVFEMVGDLAVVKQDDVPSGSEESCMQAVEECPVGAIRIGG